MPKSSPEGDDPVPTVGGGLVDWREETLSEPTPAGPANLPIVHRE